jgi:hypothetical protein
MVYFPWRQFVEFQGRFAVRAQVDAASLAREIQHTIRGIDPALAVYQARSGRPWNGRADLGRDA